MRLMKLLVGEMGQTGGMGDGLGFRLRACTQIFPAFQERRLYCPSVCRVG